jgi:hypothetical protein
MFAALVEFKREHGHFRVPYMWPEIPKSWIWVSSQRRLRKEGKLVEKRIQRLNEVGFIWDPFEAAWEEMFAALVEFKRKKGHCNVPQKWPENYKLADWVHNQRKFREQGKLAEERIQRLNEVGFMWDHFEATWEEMFTALVEFKREHGHCNMLHIWPENPKLANWMSRQRWRRERGKLSEERIQRLNEIGFIWQDTFEATWEEMFAALVEFKREYGHCRVHVRWAENPKLGIWVSTQRRYRKEGNLAEERIQRLNSIGFQWRIKIPRGYSS